MCALVIYDKDDECSLSFLIALRPNSAHAVYIVQLLQQGKLERFHI